MEIGSHRIGRGSAVYVIAEAGVNHDGDLSQAKDLVDIAADSGADAVKFQTFDPDSLVTEGTAKAAYQEGSTDGEDTQYEMLQQLKLSHDDHRELRRYCDEAGITYLSTPFDERSASFLAESGVPAIKIGSGELTNKPLLEHVATLGPPLVVSTGMATIDEVRDAYGWITDANPEVEMALLHCTSVYPTEIEDVNLRAMETLDSAFSVPVGLSDHTTRVETPALAVAAGATIVEKHFTLDRTLDGPDHGASLEPDELDRAVGLVRTASDARGDGEKEPVDAEAEMRRTTRRSLHANMSIPAGSAIDRSDIVVVRPAAGLPPSRIDEVCGTAPVRDIEAGTPITEEALEKNDDR